MSYCEKTSVQKWVGRGTEERLAAAAVICEPTLPSHGEREEPSPAVPLPSPPHQRSGFKCDCSDNDGGGLGQGKKRMRWTGEATSCEISLFMVQHRLREMQLTWRKYKGLTTITLIILVQLLAKFFKNHNFAARQIRSYNYHLGILLTWWRFRVTWIDWYKDKATISISLVRCGYVISTYYIVLYFFINWCSWLSVFLLVSLIVYLSGAEANVGVADMRVTKGKRVLGEVGLIPILQSNMGIRLGLTTPTSWHQSW